MKVKVYSTTTCPYCDMAKSFLKKNGIKFDDINVERDEKAAKEMVEKSDQMGVPVISVDETIIVGFDREKLKKLLDIK